jgi:hypothetical protein
MNFYTALTFFHAFVQPVDPVSLPIHIVTYQKDSAQVFRIWDQVEFKAGLESNLKLTQIHYYADGPQTFYTYYKMDATNHVELVTQAPAESSITNGAQFIYTDGVLTGGIEYQNRVKTGWIDYQYSGGLLMKAVFRDTVDTAAVDTYNYEGGRLTQYIHDAGSDFVDSRFTYAIKDTVAKQDYDRNGAPSADKVVLILENGNIVRNNEYRNGVLFRFSLSSYGVATGTGSPNKTGAIRNPGRFRPYDFLGRRPAHSR